MAEEERISSHECLERVDGSLFTPLELERMIKNSHAPIIFTNMIKQWHRISDWNIEKFVEQFGHLQTKFKLYHKKINPSDSKKSKVDTVTMETNCYFCNGNFKQFKEWLESKHVDDKNPLRHYKPDKHWCYADYIYLNGFLPDDVINHIDWSIFGFPQYGGKDSTLWIGSEGAFTPCHQDTYGFNLVAQIYGRKKWILIPPDKFNKLRPSRIPYEESSIFSYADEGVLKEQGFVVELAAGEALYVPKHWWHHVESLTNSISINVWIEHKTDNYDQMEESLVQLFAYFATSGNSNHSWLNPNQTIPNSVDECLSNITTAHKNYSGGINNDISERDLFDSLCDRNVLHAIIRVLNEKNTKLETISSYYIKSRY